MALDTLEVQKLEIPQKLYNESDSEFEKRRETQMKVLENLPEDLIGEIKKRGDGLAGSIFEILTEQQHKLELAERGVEEPSEIETELLDFLKITCTEIKKEGERFRRPDLIDIKVDDSGKMEIYAMVETTLDTLGKRKYFQLRDFKDDFTDFLNELDVTDLEARGYKNIARELKNISLAGDMNTIVYISADRDKSQIHTYVDSQGLDSSQWDEFEAILTEDCEIRNSVFSSDEVKKIIGVLEPYLKNN